MPEHEAVRGAESWVPMLAGVRWLADNAFDAKLGRPEGVRIAVMRQCFKRYVFIRGKA